MGTGGSLDENRVAADAAKGAYRRIHATGDIAAGFGKQRHVGRAPSIWRRKCSARHVRAHVLARDSASDYPLTANR
jgi:hypothetical protein